MAKHDVSLERVDESFHFVAKDSQGFEIHMDDASTREDGIGLGTSPMQLLLIALGGCSGIDLASILGKGRRRIDRLSIDVSGVRPDGVAPALFSDIHVVFRVDGDVDEPRVRRAVQLSLGKYCSVAKILEHTARITAAYVVNGVQYAWNPG
jgi:putative redox protein